MGDRTILDVAFLSWYRGFVVMSFHQVRIRKDGPIHAVSFDAGQYGSVTLCGFELTGLEHIRRRLFVRRILLDPSKATLTERCGRCLRSVRK